MATKIHQCVQVFVQGSVCIFVFPRPHCDKRDDFIFDIDYLPFLRTIITVNIVVVTHFIFDIGYLPFIKN